MVLALPTARHHVDIGWAVHMQASEEKVQEAESRARELYECNKRLEIHIHVSARAPSADRLAMQ